MPSFFLIFSLLKFAAIAVVLNTLTNLPAAAQVHKPANGETVECPVASVFDGTAYVVQCTDRYAGMMVAVPRVNGYSGFMFCGPLSATYICYNDAVINVADHPEPLANGMLTCAAEWNDEALRLTCKQ